MPSSPFSDCRAVCHGFQPMSKRNFAIRLKRSLRPLGQNSFSKLWAMFMQAMLDTSQRLLEAIRFDPE
jgi:hypothetical protein